VPGLARRAGLVISDYLIDGVHIKTIWNHGCLRVSPPFDAIGARRHPPGGTQPATGNERHEHNGSQTDRISATGGEVVDPTTATSDADAAEFREFLERCHDALRQHTGGNPRPYLELWSHADDVSLMGGVGGHQVGIDDVSELLTAAAKTLNYETWSAENLVTGFDDTYGFTVELERLTRQMHGETEEMRLRATSIYRREDGFWKVVHRHGDSLMTVEIDPQGRR
jgi:ketosteroid isomerase-like protein